MQTQDIKPPELSYREIWVCQYKGVGIEISLHGLIRENDFKSLNNGKGCWCYYLYIYENKTKKFNELWIEPTLEKWFETSPIRVSYNYMSATISNLPWHYGISYYNNECSVPDHRIIKAGCDYSHLWDDQERGYNFTLTEIFNEAKETANALITQFDVCP